MTLEEILFNVKNAQWLANNTFYSTNDGFVLEIKKTKGSFKFDSKAIMTGFMSQNDRWVATIKEKNNIIWGSMSGDSWLSIKPWVCNNLERFLAKDKSEK